MASTSSTSCIIKAVTLVANEQFTLPPGAEIISVSGGLDSFSSTCTKPTSVETPVRYQFKWAGTQDYNDATIVFESTDDGHHQLNNHMTGIYINNVYYGFTAFISNMDYDSNLQSRFDSTIFSGIITNASRTYFNYDATSKNRGVGAIYEFTTIPSIGDNMEIAFYTEWKSDQFGDLNGKSFSA